MKTVRIQSPAAFPDGFTWTVTVHVGLDTREMTVESGRSFDLTIPCDSIDFERDGVEPVTVTPDPCAHVILCEEPFIAQIEPPLAEQGLWLGSFALWAVLFFFFFRFES